MRWKRISRAAAFHLDEKFESARFVPFLKNKFANSFARGEKISSALSLKKLYDVKMNQNVVRSLNTRGKLIRLARRHKTRKEN